MTGSLSRYDAVLFDRDGTLIENVPYNGDPDAVRAMPGARTALDRLRRGGLRLGVVTNQSGLARGYFTQADLDAVRGRVEDLLGIFDTWQVCPHDRDDGCDCRKPRPGLILAAAARLGVDPRRCVVVGDIAADVDAAHAAGAAGVMVPNEATRRSEVDRATLILPDLTAVADWVLAPSAPPTASGSVVAAANVLAVRPDSAGDVLLMGPALRALAGGAARLTLLCGPQGRSAAELLPGVDEIIEWAVPWIDPRPAVVTPDSIEPVVRRLREAMFDRAVIFTSFHQSPLPTALLLRLAGVGHISAVSEDYPGSLLDVRQRCPGDVSEVERAVDLARAAGFRLPAGDDGTLQLRPGLPDVDTGAEPYVVVHPAASVPARACPPSLCAEFVDALTDAGWRVLVTGTPAEAPLTARVAGRRGVDLGGRTTLAELATVLRRAACLVVGNTGPAHLAAAVRTPVVSLYAPTVPFARWAPYGVPVIRLGQADAPCRASRVTVCPFPSHPCLSTVDPVDVVSAVKELTCAS
jgi:histidinol-phosphate phosphatase family protein